MKIMKTTDNIYHVICNHPDYSSKYYDFAVQDDDFLSIYGNEEETEKRNKELREMIEKEINPYNFWHDVTIYTEYFINEKMHKIYI